MSKIITTTMLAAALATSAVVPAAQADRGRYHSYHGHHSSWHGGHHRGHGYWRNGRWIALGILGAAAVGAAVDRDCYWRHGRRYCY
jgi:hypothetical protein